MSAPVRGWSEALLTSLAAALSMMAAAVPKIIGFLIIVAIGWLIAALIARAVAAVLRAVHFNDLAVKSGLSEFVKSV